MEARPVGFENETRDCTVRALSLASNIPYEKVHLAFFKVGRKDGHKVRIEKVIRKVFTSLDLEAKQIKRSGTVSKLIQQFPKGNIFCCKRGHAFAIIDGVAHDLDSINSHIKGAWLITKVEV